MRCHWRQRSKRRVWGMPHAVCPAELCILRCTLLRMLLRMLRRMPSTA